MTMSVQKQVLGFEIPVDDVLCMEVFECQGDFGGIEFGDRVWKTLDFEWSGPFQLGHKVKIRVNT